MLFIYQCKNLTHILFLYYFSCLFEKFYLVLKLKVIFQCTVLLKYRNTCITHIYALLLKGWHLEKALIRNIGKLNNSLSRCQCSNIIIFKYLTAYYRGYLVRSKYSNVSGIYLTKKSGYLTVHTKYSNINHVNLKAKI